MYELYEHVMIPKLNATGNIVAIDTDGGTKPPIYFVELDDKYKTEDFRKNILWLDEGEIAKV